MLAAELQPAVRQVVRRNGELEEENKDLYEKVHQLLAEATALRVIRQQYQSFASSQCLSPSKVIQETIYRQRRQIATLQSRLNATQAQLDSTLTAKSQMEIRLERHADSLERSTRIESDANATCRAMAKSLRDLTATCRNATIEDEEEEGGDADLLTELDTVHRHVRTLVEACAEAQRERQELAIEAQGATQAISELETRRKVLQTEKEVTDECNTRYNREREKLGKAIATLRKALDEMKKSLKATEAEKKRLKAENEQLRLELAELTK
jgi:chromosome segregation ATPase